MPQPGDFGLVPISGTGGKLIALGQLLIGVPSKYQHAFILLDDNQIAQAEPGGVEIRPLSIYRNTKVKWSSYPLTAAERAAIVRFAREHVGTPYSWLDYVAIGLHRWKMPSSLLRKYVHDTGHMICSQFVAEAYAVGGYPLGKRAPQEMTPGDLDKLLRKG